MASSQVEIASSPRFDGVLSRRDRYRESNARAAAFQKNLKDLVRDHFHNCISVSSNDNSKSHTKNADSWAGNEQRNQHNHRNLRFSTNNNKNRDGNDQSSIMNSKQCRIIDRWAAKQARDMMSSIEKQSQEAELLGAPSSSRTETASTWQKNPPPDDLKNSPAEPANLGASSLVQIWEARMNRSNSINANNLNPSRTSSGLSNVENLSSLRIQTSRGSEMSDYMEERFDTAQENPENSFPDWETQTDRTAMSEPPTSRNSDAGESERVRIADIIKRLTSGSDDNDNETGSNSCESPSRERRHAPFPEPVEQRGLTQVVSSPKIRVRGRQAFADLFMQLERDRHRELDSLLERQTVSKFPQRGRIQSLLRLRFLKQGMACRDQERPQSAGSPSNRSSLGSSIMQLREKFGTGIENGVPTSSRNSRTEMANNMSNQDDSSPSNRLSEDDRLQEVLVSAKSSEGPDLEGSQRTDDAQQVTDSGNTLLDSRETAETTALLIVCDGNEMGEDQEANNHQQENSETRAILDDQNENEMAYEEQEASDHQQQQQQLFLHHQETTETAAFMDNWYENEVAEAEESYEHHQFVENNHDWITEISRPRSHWENLRQTWYQERLSSSADNDEIRQLIERKRVSTFLSSDFRDTMDQLMASRATTQTDIGGYREEEDESTQERMSQLLLSHLQRHLQHPASTSQEEEQTQERDQVEEEQEEEYHDQEEEEEEEDDHYQEEEEEEEGEEEEESSIGHQFHETGQYFQSSSTIQMPSPSMITTWSFRDNEAGDDSDPAASPSPQPLPSQTYYHQSPDPANRLSIEMELVYDMRGQIEQLHREMAELRKSLQSCIEMQHSNQQEVHPVRVMANNPVVVAPNKRNCCICYEMKVDSLLYRCGHMCTCLKCAHELQWSSGKCPICRAPIDDVVRAYMDA